MATLERARREPTERRVLDELVARLRVELVGNLLAVWLYGSRARGERAGEDSDVDLLVFTARGREDSDIVRRLVVVAADAAGGQASTFSARVLDRDDLEHGRRIHSFYSGRSTATSSCSTVTSCAHRGTRGKRHRS